ncbi:hypothetical protein [Nitriliruptor alkaliphilus]|uniref:hypothetical protein n=1 Tax=Nitriliruptor alkaliphilus TaxID=427918 RepID=UPI0006986A0F|nr:hypothetical protein [Nitriliruptor alkaliphilus]
MRMITRVVVCAVALALMGCGSDDDPVTADPAAAEGDDDGGGAAGALDEPDPLADGEDDPDGPDDLGDADGATDRPPLACPSEATVIAITGVDITGFSGPAAGDPTPLTCQYTGDDSQFRTGTAVYISLDVVDTGPNGFGRSVGGLGVWAEVASEEGVIYVGFGDGVLEIGTYAELSDDQLVDLVEATLEAGVAGG